MEEARHEGVGGNDDPGDAQVRLGLQKKSLAAAERDEGKRRSWRERLRGVDPKRLVLVDECSTNVALTTGYARAPRGERARGSATRNWGKNGTLASSISAQGINPSISIEGSLDGGAFGLYVGRFLRPALRREQIVVTGNLSAHKGRQARRLIEEAGCELWYLSPYSPDLNSIEEVFSEVQGCLRRAKARTYEALLVKATGWALDAVSEEDARGFFANSGYEVPRVQVQSL